MCVSFSCKFTVKIAQRPKNAADRITNDISFEQLDPDFIDWRAIYAPVA